MIRRLLSVALGLGLLGLACNATPDIPNDLRSNNGTYPRKGSAADDSDSEANNEGEEVLTGGRAPSPTGGQGGDAGSGTTPSPAPDAGTTPAPAPDAGTTTSGPPLNAACAGTADQSACFECCEQEAPGTIQKWSAFWDDCACAAGTCGAACAQSWCAGFYPNPGDACDNCLAGVADSCSAQAEATCKADATCAPLVACDEGSACATKP